MMWKKGLRFRKLPPLAMIQSIMVEHQKGVWMPGQLITRSMYASMSRDGDKIPPGHFYFHMDFDTKSPGLHIYPPPDKQITVRVRYLPKVVEI